MNIDYSLEIDRKVVYLLLHLGGPIFQGPPSRKYIQEASKAAKKLGIIVSSIKIGTSSGGVDRILFRFPYYKRDDEKANFIAETLLYSINITGGPIGDENESSNIFPIPSIAIKDKTEVHLAELLDIEERRPYGNKTIDYPGLYIGSSSQVFHVHLASAWKITPFLVDNRNLHNAARFLNESQRNFYVWPGQFDEVLHDDAANFRTGWERSALEIALLNTFRVIEALIGDPPSSDKKLIRKIRKIGIDPYKEFGIEPRLPLYQYIRKINTARDKISAHGSTPIKNILVRDMFLFQDCAKYMLVNVIESCLGESLYAS